MIQTNTIAIAGGRGFIGGNVAKVLREQGVKLNVFGREGVQEIKRYSSETLIWAAGGRSGSKAALEEEHIKAPLRAIEKIHPNQFVYLSSAEVYGRAQVPFYENGQAHPITAYGRTKLHAEKVLRDVCCESSVKFFVLRLAVVYGPGQTGTMLIPSAIDTLGKGDPFETTDGQQTRDFIHVDDVVRAVQACLSTKSLGGIYNIGSGKETRVLDVLSEIADAFGPEARVNLKLGVRKRRPGEAMRYVMNIQRAGQKLNWEPKVGIREGIRNLCAAQSGVD